MSTEMGSRGPFAAAEMIIKPIFLDNLEPDDLKDYEEFLGVRTKFLDELVKYGNEAIAVCIKKAEGDSRLVHVALIGLARYHLSLFDSVNILLSKGCIEGALPLLRTMLDTFLGIAHIAQDKHEERALAYQLVRHLKEIKEYRMADKRHNDRHHLEADLASDVMFSKVLDYFPEGRADIADAIEAKLNSDPVYVPIIAEWNRLKQLRKKRPRVVLALWGCKLDSRTG